MDYNAILQRIQEEVSALYRRGKVASYIPALARIPSRKFGMAVKLLNGEEYTTGDAAEAFSIQSISKLITLTLYIRKYGLEIGNRVGVEPSGSAFNSLVQLEYEQGIPRNPFINAGAIVLTDGLINIYPDIKQRVLEFARTNSNNNEINFDEEVAKSEHDTGYRNFALANFMKSFGNIENDISVILDAYFHHCSLSMSCIDLAKCFFFLANEGVSQNKQRILSPRETKRINAIMLTCGTYDAVGDFAFRVGIPAKSGVGGGIIGVIPNKMSIAVWSPELNAQGNSVLGMKAMELLTTYTGISIF
jgi:glutaminase